MGLTDQELVALAQRGDRKAFHLLVDRCAPRLYKAAAVMTGNYTDAQDLVQETLLGAYEALPGFENRSSIHTWLTGIMIRQASLQRRKAARSRMQSLDHPDAPQQPDRSSLTGRAVAQSDAKADLVSLMARLSEEHRQVLMLREIQGLSYDEIASQIQQPRGTVESRLFRARQALREIVQKQK